MSFNEADVRRDQSGKFDTKEGSAPTITLTGPQKIADLPKGEPFDLYPGRETDLDNSDVLEWLEERDVKTTATYTGQRYSKDGKGPLQHRYSVTLEKDGKTLEVPFSTGTGWDEAPSAGLVVETLISDAQLHREGKRSFVSLMEDMPAQQAEWEYTKLAASARQFRDFVGEDFGRLMDGEYA